MNLIKKENRFLFPSLVNDFLMNDRLNAAINAGSNIPAVNIQELDDSFKVDLAAPGMSREDFTIDLDDDMITVSAQKSTESSEKDKEGKYTRREFGYTSFARSFTLPDAVKQDEINATYTDGVLSITIPKDTETKVEHKRTIAIS